MDRRRCLRWLLALTAATGASGVKAQARTPRIGILILASLPSVTSLIEDLRASLRDLGHVDGRSIVIEILSAEGNAERLPELAAKLVEHKVDIIIAGGGNVSTLAARRASATIPIVMTSSIGAVEAGLVQSLARPGGNITGMTIPTELGFKQLQLLQELVPGLSRVALLVRHDPARVAAREQGRAYAQQLLGVTLEMFEAHSPEDLASVLGALRAARPQAMIVSPDPLLYQRRAQIVQLARAARIADMYPLPDIVDDGGLVAYAPSPHDISLGVARFVDRLLKGAKPADLPVEQPTRFVLAINLGTAKSLGIKVPPALLLRADRVIE